MNGIIRSLGIFSGFGMKIARESPAGKYTEKESLNRGFYRGILQRQTFKIIPEVDKSAETGADYILEMQKL